jgi:hypothetical protein
MACAGSGVPISVLALETERLCGLSVSPLSSPMVSLRLRRELDMRLRRLAGLDMPGDWLGLCFTSVVLPGLVLTRDARRASRRLEMRVVL